MQDIYSRQIEYLRIAVTDRCNLRCTYCMPAEGLPLKSHAEILSLEEIFQIVKAVVPLGIDKIRLTGGEPLVRLGLVDLVKQIRTIPEIKDISLTTNGILLSEFAESLKNAGLNRVNISLDTLDKAKFRQITRLGDIAKVHQGIEAALKAGLEPVKLNVVVIKGVNDGEILDFIELTRNKPLHVRFIELMPIGESDAKALASYLPAEEIKQLVQKKYNLTAVTRVTGSGPAKYYKIDGFKGTVGFIGAISAHFCHNCNRLRLTADGKLRPCLQKSLEYDLLTPLRQGVSQEELRKIVAKAIRHKPKEHDMEVNGWGKQKRGMSQIGG
jgi:cyclic pyranopterin phosphate synthase